MSPNSLRKKFAMMAKTAEMPRPIPPTGFATTGAVSGPLAAILVVASIYLLSFAWTGVVHELLTLGSGVLGL